MANLIASPRQFRFVQAILRLLAVPLLDWKVSGVENIPAQGPLLVILNHTSWLDLFLPGLFFPRPLVGFAKIEAFHSYPIAWVLRWMRFVPIRRGEVDRAALGRAIQVLNSGGGFVVAPEGTRTQDGRMIQAKPGVALLATAAHPIILPIGVVGTKRDSVVRNLRSLHRTRVDIRIGPPVILDATRATKSSRQEITDELMLQIAQLLPEEQRGYYAGKRLGETLYTRNVGTPDTGFRTFARETEPCARETVS